LCIYRDDLCAPSNLKRMFFAHLLMVSGEIPKIR
jgi:hypothetical protein